MSTCEEDEPFDLMGRSGGVGHTGVASLDTIIQSLNKRYEVYQRRRTAMTPFGSPGDPSMFIPPTPHSILGDSTMASGSVSGGGGAAAMQSLMKSHEAAKESIVAPRPRPAPYWEERELYIVAEDLCCCLNGGINYRLLCEQYQRALEVVLTLVREDVRMCMSGDLELVPGGMTKSFLTTLKSLLRESKRMLDEAGVNVPHRLANMIERLPSNSSSVSDSSGGASHASLHVSQHSPAAASANRGGATPPTVSMAHTAGRTPNSSMALSERLMSTGGGGSYTPGSASAGGSVFAAAGCAANHSGSLPSPYAQSCHTMTNCRHPTSAGLHGNSTRDDGVDDGSTAAAGRRPPPAPPSRPRVGSPEHGHLLLGRPGSGGGNGLSRPAQPRVASSSSAHLPSAIACRSMPNLAAIVDNTLDDRNDAGGEGASAVDIRSLHEGGGSILRSGSSYLNSVSSGTAPTPATSAKASPIAPAGRPPKRQALPPPPTAPVKHRPATESTSPVPATPPSAGDVSGAQRNSRRVMSNSVAGSSSAAQMKTGLLVAEKVGEDKHDVVAAPAPVRDRLRRLEVLYGEHYAMDGLAMLTDALGVVFTREYDHGHSPPHKDAFTAFRRDVNGKVMPVLESYESLQLRIAELEPLRCSYLASCLAHCVRPNNAVLEHLKHIDDDRSVETMRLGGLRLGDRGMTAFVESVVPRLYRLRRLDLSDNDVNDGALEPLLRSVRYHPSLEHLNLSRNPLTDGALPLLLRIVQTLPRLSELLLQSCAMEPATRQMVEAEVMAPGACPMTVAASRHSRQSPSQVGSLAVLPTRAAAASAPRPGLPWGRPRPVPPGGERRSGPLMPAVRAESVPCKLSKTIDGTGRELKAAFPRGMGVVLEPILPGPTALSPTSLSARSLPGSHAEGGVSK
ncbi:hypothetical protein GH5_07830 [Leishmania sp. Ghana 2012 LV757]|uniref:hypothetical protein n=1 Tax=Leishmania sp. Ghana 2012 LV757 TaxID=2803181 RepID=UPI001B44AE85|nr:hypothetical protein GH5_07830 [Leishmania sp. Ghana 2012 LV757]